MPGNITVNYIQNLKITCKIISYIWTLIHSHTQTPSLNIEVLVSGNKIPI